jgi:hypothetical protein
VTTVADWVETVKDYVLSGAREEMDILNGTINSSVTSLVDTDATNGIQQGAEIEIDLERMYVRSVSTLTVTVTRGYRGSTAASHTSGATIIVLPKVPKAAIVRELNNELASLSSPANGLFRTSTVDLTWSGSQYGYNLTGVTDIEDVLSVQWQGYTGYDWIPVPATSWRLGRAQNTSDFSTGLALFFDEPVAGRSVRVVYRAPFTSVSALTDNVESVTGLPATAVDIPPLGAAINLSAPGEIRRSFFDGQGDPRADEDVPPGARTNSVRWLMQRRQVRIGEESARLSRDFPTVLAR